MKAAPAQWRRRLRRELGWLLLAKLAALALLWSLFFSPAHRSTVDGSRVAYRFSLPSGPQGVKVP